MVKRAKNYANTVVTAELGALLKDKRLAKNYSLDDIAQMTQFPKSTILNIEKGISTNIHYYVAYAQSVEFAILPVDVPLKPIFELSPERKSRLFLTLKIKELLKTRSFFDRKRSVSDVLEELKLVYKIETTKLHSTNVSRILLNLIDEGLLLLAGKKGRNNLYLQAKKGK